MNSRGLDIILEGVLKDLGLNYYKDKDFGFYKIYSPEKNMSYVVNTPNTLKELGKYITNIVNYFEKHDNFAEMFRKYYDKHIQNK